MNWAFWRAKQPAGAAKADADDAQDPAAELHGRTRRRLIGAAALLLAAVIVLPMVLDSTPRPVPDTVAIDIPSDKTPFTPRLSVPAPVVPAASAPAAPSAPPAKKADAAPKPEQPAAAEDARPSASSAAAKESAPAPQAAGASFALQAAALAHDSAVRDLVAKLKKAGFAPYTEKVSTKNGERIRVRVGPYASREDAERARAKLKSLGIDAGVVNG